MSQTILGISYLHGYEVEVDYAEAFRLLSAASAQGASRAIANLAHMYAEGLGIPQNMDEAIRLYESAALRGEFIAQIDLARIYARGIGVAANPKAARHWYATAVAQADRANASDEINEAKAYLADRP